MELSASGTASSTRLAPAASTAFSAACCSFPCSAAISPSGVITTRCVLGGSANFGAGGFKTAGDGEGNVATSAILCSIFTGGSLTSSVTGGGFSRAGGTAVANCARGTLVVPALIPSWGAVTILQAVPGFSRATPTCYTSLELVDVWTYRTR